MKKTPIETVPAGTQIQARILAEFECPFCGNLGAAIERTNDGGVGVLHEVPYCKEFDELEPDEYIRAVRQKLSPESFS